MAELIETPLTVVHVISCAFLILVVLLQPGKSGGLGAFSGAAAQQVFGGRGAGNFLTKTTWIIAAVFFMTSLSLAYLSSTGDESLEALATELEDAAHARRAPEADVRAPVKSAEDEEADIRRDLDAMMAGDQAGDGEAARREAAEAPSASGGAPSGAAAADQAPRAPGKGIVPSPQPAPLPVQPRSAPVPARPAAPPNRPAPPTQSTPTAPAAPPVPPAPAPAPPQPVTPPAAQTASPQGAPALPAAPASNPEE